jgi:hypothetical protein
MVKMAMEVWSLRIVLYVCLICLFKFRLRMPFSFLNHALRLRKHSRPFAPNAIAATPLSLCQSALRSHNMQGGTISPGPICIVLLMAWASREANKVDDIVRRPDV